MIQDLVFTAGSLAFSVALVPAVRAPEKPARWSCAMTASVLLIFAVTYATLGLYYSAATTALTALMWAVLLLQRRPQDDPSTALLVGGLTTVNEHRVGSTP